MERTTKVLSLLASVFLLLGSIINLIRNFVEPSNLLFALSALFLIPAVVLYTIVIVRLIKKRQ
ncbi:MAG: hypothetical protein E7539_07020 [Ruminococcaceae bacterium]|nr:hypothetical protein [Oscillospiraceae bacterium]